MTEQKRVPNRRKRPVSLTIDDAVLSDAEAVAREERRSTSSLVEVAIVALLRKRAREQAEDDDSESV